MKQLPYLVLVGWSPTVFATHANGNDDSDRASFTASCNASFQEDCPEIHTEGSLSSSAVAAPIGPLGESSFELVLTLIIAGIFLVGARRSPRSHPPRQPAGKRSWVESRH